MARWRGWWLVCPLVAGCLGVSLGPFTPHTAHAAPSLTSRAPLRPRLSASPPPPPPPPGDELSRAADLRNWRSFRARLVQRDKSAPLPPHQPQQTQSQQTRPDTWAGGVEGAGGGGGWWVHELAVPEPGCLLLAQPHAIFAQQPWLRRSAILVLTHSPSNGTTGLLLRRSANVTLGERERSKLFLFERERSSLFFFVKGTRGERERRRKSVRPQPHALNPTPQPLPPGLTLAPRSNPRPTPRPDPTP